jgi:hypothetical protein
VILLTHEADEVAVGEMLLGGVHREAWCESVTRPGNAKSAYRSAQDGIPDRAERAGHLT